MNPSRLVIPASLGLNVVLIGCFVYLRLPHSESKYTSSPDVRASPSGSPAPSSSGVIESERVVSTVPPAPDAPPPETWTRLQSSSLATFVANLRAAGLPDYQVRALVNAEINERFRAREEAARPSRASRKFWETGNTYYNDPTTLEQRLAQLDIRREKAALRRELLGDTPRAPDDDNPIPPDKRELLRTINDDYNTMISQVNRETRGISLASDQETLRYLRAEKEAELRAALTPEEYREYEIRSSSTASRLRNDLVAFNPSEQEFRSLFELRRQFDEQFPSQPDQPSADYWKQRQEAQKALDARIAQQLGPERARDYTRAKDQDYRSLATLADRLGLPPSTANQVYDLRYTVPSDAMKIIRSADLSPDAKRERLQAIGRETRDRLVAQLGAEAADAYLKRHGQWIKSLEQGRVMEYKPDGSRQTHQVPQ